MTQPATPRLRVLLVEDDVDLLDVLASQLADEGFEPLTARDGGAALLLARSTPPDVIVSDIAMPGMDGRQLLAEVRADPTLREIPLVLLTGLASRDEVRAAMQHGADDFITKPFRVEEVTQAVRSQAGRAAARRSLVDDSMVKARAEILSDLPAELLTQLNAIVGPSELLADAEDGTDAAQVRELGSLIRQGAFNLQRLVGNFIFHNNLAHAVTVSLRHASGRCYSSEDYFRAIRHSLAETAKTRGRPMECFHLSGTLPPMALPPAALGKVMCELLDNAAAYSPDDSDIHIRCLKSGLTKIEVSNRNLRDGHARPADSSVLDPLPAGDGEGRRGLKVCNTLLKPFGGCVTVDERRITTTATIILPLSQSPGLESA